MCRLRTARLSCAQADAVSWRCGSIDTEISRQRRGLTAARFKPTPHHGVDTKSRRKRPANRSDACPHRCAVAALRHNVALCAASQASRTAGRAAASAAVRAARRITHVMSPVGVLRTGHALKQCGLACLQPLTRLHPRAWASTGACCTRPRTCAQPRCVCAHVGLRVVARVARGNRPRLRHLCRHALCV
jgi:hypothetical protein